MRWVLAALAAGVACDAAHEWPSIDELPGVHVLEQRSDRVIATITQPVDHDDPTSLTFEQRFVVYPVDDDAPTVVDIEGYSLGDGFGQHEPTTLIDGNEVQLEHRFFGDSMADDWSKLTLAQAAADVHALVTVLRQHYSGPWISTGASKGGIEALIHRQLYPDDVRGTIAYVAPGTSGLRDERYPPFVASRGDAACRASLVALARGVLTEPRRSRLATALATYLEGHHLDVLGADRILELTTRETSFTFWQYGNASRCSTIPDMTEASDEAVIAFLDATNSLALWSDDGLTADQGYWYASATELGYPADDYSVVADLARYFDPPTPVQLTFVVTPPTYDPAPMTALTSWVATAETVLLLYGENDPWTVGALTGVDVHLVPAGNHASRLRDLPDDERTAAEATLHDWLAR